MTKTKDSKKKKKKREEEDVRRSDVVPLGRQEGPPGAIGGPRRDFQGSFETLFEFVLLDLDIALLDFEFGLKLAFNDFLYFFEVLRVRDRSQSLLQALKLNFPSKIGYLDAYLTSFVTFRRFCRIYCPGTANRRIKEAEIR